MPLVVVYVGTGAEHRPDRGEHGLQTLALSSGSGATSFEHHRFERFIIILSSLGGCLHLISLTLRIHPQQLSPRTWM